MTIRSLLSLVLLAFASLTQAQNPRVLLDTEGGDRAGVEPEAGL